MALNPLVAASFPRKAPPAAVAKQIAMNTRMMGKKRDITHKLSIGGLHVTTLKGWSKNEMAYSAGSTATATIPIDPDFDLFALYQAHLKEHDKPLTFDVTTTMYLNSTEVAFKDAADFSGVITSLRMSRKSGVYTITAASYAQILQNEKVTISLFAETIETATTSDLVGSLVRQYGKGLKTVDGKGKTTVYASKLKVKDVFGAQGVQQAVNMSVWDLLMSFASKDGVDMFVKGDVLYYAKKPTDPKNDITELNGVEPSYTYTWDENILDLEIEHSPLFAHDISVTVKSYQTSTQQTYTSTATMSEAKVRAIAAQLERDPASLKIDMDKSIAKMDAQRKPRKGKVVTSAKLTAARVGNKENYTFTLQNATQEDCDRVAAQIAEDISRKEFVVTLTVLGQPDFNPRQYIRLRNTGSKATDQVYAIKSINTRSELSQTGGETEGYLTTFVLVNHAVQSVGASLGV